MGEMEMDLRFITETQIMVLTDCMSISVEKRTFHDSQFGHLDICVFHLLKWENKHRNKCWGREVRDNHFKFG